MKSIWLWGFTVVSLFDGMAVTELAMADQEEKDRTVRAEPTGLDKVASLSFKRKPLQEALAEIAKLADLKLEIDGEALKRKGLTKNMPVNLEIRDVKLSDALRKVLDISSMELLNYELWEEGKTLSVRKRP